ncbi:MAG TPA: glycerol-3-phosphate acyltransferase, partial [Candidatus Dormibacteraeota bacterium]|nr:glycerol-3-phosphate acyltransferase [Candidatus Dormibacteraeota bacterium]
TSPLNREWLAICAGIAAVLGHNYTCWLNFKGGKGVATSAGVLGALVPWTLVISLSLWILVVAFSRYVSLASVCAALSLPFATWATAPNDGPGQRTTLTIITGVLGALGIYKHKPNIQRLLAGTENRLGPKKPAPQPSQGPST